MTPKQIDRLKNKITKLKRALAADKRAWGGHYHDGQGLRYLLPELYLKLQDYTGALRYFNWFSKNFPDDSGYPVFLFEWTITLFKTKRIKQAENKALQTFFTNPYLIDEFLEKEPLDLRIAEHSNWEGLDGLEHFHYLKDQDKLSEFSEWLEKFISSERFSHYAKQFIDIERKLKTEAVGPARSELVNKRYRLLEAIEDE